MRTNLNALREVNRSAELTSQEVLRLDALVNQLNSIVGPLEQDPAREYAEAMAAQASMEERRAEENSRSAAAGFTVSAGLAPLPMGTDTSIYEADDVNHDPSALLASLKSDEETLSMDLNEMAKKEAPSLPPSAPKLPGIPERPTGGGKKDAA
ncbi:MAG: hypothetical protein EOP11_14395 [Proteobacteria bacterium]|nr:MAG: hypothetical protein EOP11_14395 [Pseudomonadota bacterium]